MKKKMKFIGMSAAILLAISPVATPILGVGSATVYADASYDMILRNALKTSARVNDWDNDSSIKESLRDLVNSGAKKDYYKGQTTADSNAFFRDIVKTDISRGKTLQTILGAAGENSEAQFFVNGKTDVTMEDLSSSVLTLTVKVFGTDGKTAEADITLNTDAPEIGIKESVSLNKVHEDRYLDLTEDPSDYFEVIGGSEGWTILDADEGPNVAKASPSKIALASEGFIDAEGYYDKVGSYTQLITVTLSKSGTLTEKRTISVTVNVAYEHLDESEFSFDEAGGDGVYKSGSTVLNHALSIMDERETGLKKLSEILIQNNPDYFDVASKVTNRAQLERDLKNRFLNLFNVFAELGEEGPDYENPRPQDYERLSVDSSNIDFSKENSLVMVPITYVTEFGKTMTITLEVLVKQATYPIIEFNTNQDMTINVGTAFNLYDFKAYQDSVANLLTSSVSISGSVNTSKVGTYELTYSVANKYNLKTTLIRTINVVDSNNNKPTITSFETVGYVKYVEGYGIRVWSTPADNGRNQYLPHGTAWKIDQKATFKDGTVWYRVGTDQWVDASYIKFSPVSSSDMKELKGVGTINYVQGYSVNLYRGAEALGENWTGNQLKHGTTWRVYGEKNGFYNLGGDQWVSTKYVSFQKD